jgi:hypothetical protein
VRGTLLWPERAAGVDLVTIPVMCARVRQVLVERDGEKQWPAGIAELLPGPCYVPAHHVTRQLLPLRSYYNSTSCGLALSTAVTERKRGIPFIGLGCVCTPYVWQTHMSTFQPAAELGGVAVTHSTD